jgi:hypothetical protein
LATAESAQHVFPPALVPVLREHVTAKGGCLADVPDDVLVELLTTVFWAGLETYEGEHRPVGIVFLGTSMADFVTPEGSESGEAPLYQWKILRFTTPRPFAVSELVKLAVAGVDRRIYAAVSLLRDGRLAIAGLAREGFNMDPDPFVKVIALRPGSLSVRSGTDLMLGYERGTTLTGGEDVVFGVGPVRRRLEALARAVGSDDRVVADYVKAVQSLVREMAAHGHGGILIVGDDDHADVAKAAAYHMVRDSSLLSLLQLARHLGPTRNESGSRRSPADDPAFRNVLRSTFLTEAERVTEELGALTAIDGAVLLNRDLALVAFGVMLPLRRPTTLAQAKDAEGLHSRIIDFASRGTRHRAAATYAADHPGHVVFVASEDGELSCLFRDSTHQQTLLWRLGRTVRRAR